MVTAPAIFIFFLHKKTPLVVCECVWVRDGEEVCGVFVSSPECAINMKKMNS